jgi:hypothetical protein
MQSFAAREIGRALAAAMVTFAASIGAADHVDSPGQGMNARVHEARAFETGPVDKLGAQPWRTHFGRTDVYIPTFFEPKDGTYDLIVHFHGLAAAQESNVERSGVNAVVASVNLGVGSGPYEDTFKEGWTFPNLVKVIDKAVARSGRAKGAHLGRIALSAWSAGYGSVSAILRVPSNASRIDALLLADGLHSDYTDERRHVVDDGPLGKYLKVAQQAMRGADALVDPHHGLPEHDGDHRRADQAGGRREGSRRGRRPARDVADLPGRSRRLPREGLPGHRREGAHQSHLGDERDPLPVPPRALESLSPAAH